MKIYKLKELIIDTINGEWGTEVEEGQQGVKVLRTTNFTNIGKLDLEKEVVLRDISTEKVDKKRLIKGDIIIEKSGGSKDQPVGRVVYFDEEDVYLCNNFTSVLRPNKELIEPKYLLYQLLILYRKKKVLKYQNQTTGIINLKLDKYLSGVSISVPSLEIQKKIVVVLDKVFSLIEKRQSQIAALDELLESTFVNLKNENSIEYRLVDICDINPPKNVDSNSEELVSFVPMSNVSETGELFLEQTSQIKEVYKGFTYFEENDVLFAKITPCMENGKGCLARNLVNKKGFGSTEFHVLRARDNNLSIWVYQLTKSKKFRNQAELIMTGSAGQKRVPKSFLENYKVCLPSENEIVKFNILYEDIRIMKIKMKECLEKEMVLYNSLLQKAFRGELFKEAK